MRKEKARKGSVVPMRRRLWMGQIRESMLNTLQLIPSDRRSGSCSGTTHEIICGRPKITNGQLPPATGTTLTNNRDLAHWSATRTNLACLKSWRRQTGAPKTPWLNSARRKFMAHNFPPDIFSKEINDEISLDAENVNQIRKIHPYFP
jgi:hypothetical protein